MAETRKLTAKHMIAHLNLIRAMGGYDMEYDHENGHIFIRCKMKKRSQDLTAQDRALLTEEQRATLDAMIAQHGNCGMVTLNNMRFFPERPNLHSDEQVPPNEALRRGFGRWAARKGNGQWLSEHGKCQADELRAWPTMVIAVAAVVLFFAVVLHFR